jgi:hypothetical protein
MGQATKARRWRWGVVNSMSWHPLYRRVGGPQGRSWTGAENLAQTGVRPLNRPVRSESLYRLGYPGPHLTSVLDGIQNSDILHWLVLTDHDYLSIKLHNIMIRYVTFHLYLNITLCDKCRLAFLLGLADRSIVVPTREALYRREVKKKNYLKIKVMYCCAGWCSGKERILLSNFLHRFSVATPPKQRKLGIVTL